METNAKASVNTAQVKASSTQLKATGAISQAINELETNLHALQTIHTRIVGVNNKLLGPCHMPCDKDVEEAMSDVEHLYRCVRQQATVIDALLAEVNRLETL